MDDQSALKHVPQCAPSSAPRICTKYCILKVHRETPNYDLVHLPKEVHHKIFLSADPEEDVMNIYLQSIGEKTRRRRLGCYELAFSSTFHCITYCKLQLSSILYVTSNCKCTKLFFQL